MIFGAITQTLTMVLLAVLGAVDTPAANIVSCVLLFAFNTFFAVGWLGMTWLYVSCYEQSCSIARSLTHGWGCQPAEIVGIRIRAAANALSTASNWTLVRSYVVDWSTLNPRGRFNFLVVMVTGPAFANISWRTYIGLQVCTGYPSSH